MFHSNNLKKLKNPRVLLLNKQTNNLLILPGTNHIVFCVGDSLSTIEGGEWGGGTSCI